LIEANKKFFWNSKQGWNYVLGYYNECFRGNNFNYFVMYVIIYYLKYETLFLKTQVSDERKVFLRERSNKLYSVLAYFLAKTLCELPIYFISVSCSIAIVYPSINLNDTFSGKYYAWGKDH